jgi:hypothetical protein
MLAQRLDFSPGTRFAYSNFGYELLRAVIAKVPGQPYTSYDQFPNGLGYASLLPAPSAPGSLATLYGTGLGGTGANPSLLLRDAAGLETPLPILASNPASLVSTAPGLFTLNPSGLLAATLVRTDPALITVPWAAPPSWEPVFQLDPAGRIVPKPIEFGEPGQQLSLIVFCTGVRGRSSPSAITLSLGDLSLPVSITIGGAVSNTATLAFR